MVQLKNILMATYFGADHFVWAYQIGLITDKAKGDRWQKVSLYSWALGSLCTLFAEGYMVGASGVVRKEVRTRTCVRVRVCVCVLVFCCCTWALCVWVALSRVIVWHWATQLWYCDWLVVHGMRLLMR